MHLITNFSKRFSSVFSGNTLLIPKEYSLASKPHDFQIKQIERPLEKINVKHKNGILMLKGFQNSTLSVNSDACVKLDGILGSNISIVSKKCYSDKPFSGSGSIECDEINLKNLMSDSISLRAKSINLDSYYVNNLNLSAEHKASVNIGCGNGDTNISLENEANVSIKHFENGSLNHMQKEGSLSLFLDDSVSNLNIYMGEGIIEIHLSEPKNISSLYIDCTELEISDDVKNFIHDENRIEMPESVQYSAVFAVLNNIEPENLWKVHVLKGKVKICLKSGWIDSIVKDFNK